MANSMWRDLRVQIPPCCWTKVLTSILQMPDDLLAIMNPFTAALMWFVLLIQWAISVLVTKEKDSTHTFFVEIPNFLKYSN